MTFTVAPPQEERVRRRWIRRRSVGRLSPMRQWRLARRISIRLRRSAQMTCRVRPQVKHPLHFRPTSRQSQSSVETDRALWSAFSSGSLRRALTPTKSPTADRVRSEWLNSAPVNATTHVDAWSNEQTAHSRLALGLKYSTRDPGELIGVYEIKVGAMEYARPKSLQTDRRECNSAGQWWHWLHVRTSAFRIV